MSTFWAPSQGTGTSTTGNRYTFAPAAPADPLHGDQWTDSRTGRTYHWLDDGDTFQWVENGPVRGGMPGLSAYEVAVENGFVGTEEEWLASLEGPEGPQGIEGPMGTQGIGITYAGTVDTEADLPASATQGDLYVVSTPEPAHGFVWDDATASWADSGPVQGPQGIQGIEGPVGPTGPTAVSVDAGNTSRLGSDGLIFTAPTNLSGYLPLAGGTMSGTINVPDGINAIRTASGFNLIGNNSAFAVRLNTTNLMAFGINTIDAYKPISLPADPLQPLHAVTKQYVDAKFASGGYVLPVATASVLGGVKVGAGLAITAEGVLSAASAYTLPIATATVLGGIKIGTGLTAAADGTVSAAATALTPATATVLGGIKVGAGLAVTTDGTLSSLAGGVANPVAGSVAGLTLWVGTQAAYDAIATKDAKTLYHVQA